MPIPDYDFSTTSAYTKFIFGKNMPAVGI